MLIIDTWRYSVIGIQMGRTELCTYTVYDRIVFGKISAKNPYIHYMYGSDEP